MAYEFVTLKVFKRKLKNNDYSGATGARRALGRVQSMSKADKNAAKSAIDRKFGKSK